MKGAPDSSSVMTACVRPEAAAWRSLSARSASRPESGGWVMVITRVTCHVSRVTSPPRHMSRVTQLSSANTRVLKISHFTKNRTFHYYNY